MDGIQEGKLGQNEIGMTKKGIGPEATTFRARRVGWLDILMKYSTLINGFTALNLTKLNVLTGLWITIHPPFSVYVATAAVEFPTVGQIKVSDLRKRHMLLSPVAVYCCVVVSPRSLFLRVQPHAFV